MSRVLLLAGVGEASQIAEGIAAQDVPCVVSFAGGSRPPMGFPLPYRTGGFGGAEAFERFLSDEGITAVLDATHPFAEAISARTAKICAALKLPYACYHREGWAPQEGDLWTDLAEEVGAAEHIEEGATVFLATGRRTLEAFANLKNCRVIARQIDKTSGEFPFEGGEFLVGHPPFSVEDEMALFKELGVDWLIVKNAGGAGAYAKLEAARRLGLRVGMIRQPDPPEGAHIVRSVGEALNWVKQLDG